jgi:hypothetical protein
MAVIAVADGLVERGQLFYVVDQGLCGRLNEWDVVHGGSRNCG